MLLALCTMSGCNLLEEIVVDPTTAPPESLETTILPPIPDEDQEVEAQNTDSVVIETLMPTGEDQNVEAPMKKPKDIPVLKNDVKDLSPYLNLENLSELAILLTTKNGFYVRPIFAYDKDRVILFSWDGSTGYSSELLLYDLRDQSLVSIFKCPDKYDSVYCRQPLLSDVEKGELLILYKIDSGKKENTYIYDLNSSNLTEVSLSEADREIRYLNIFNTTDNDYDFVEVEDDNIDYPWELRNTKTKEVIGSFTKSGYLSYLGEDLLVHISGANHHYYLYHDGQWYKFPQTIEDWYIVGIDALPDGHFFIYVADHIGYDIGRILAIKYVLRGQLND